MISEKAYYKLIYNNFISKNMDKFAECDETKLEKLEIPKCFDWFYELLDKVEANYGFNMQKMLSLNYNKFVLWQRCFEGESDIERINVAMQLIVFCCLADKILDSLRFKNAQKERVCDKLDIKNFTSENDFSSTDFEEMDILLNSIRLFLSTNKDVSPSETELILHCMEKAFESEIYMYKFPLLQFEKMEKKDYRMLTDKSVQFEMAAFILATYGNNNTTTFSAANYVGNIFWLIDDLCDLIDDIKGKRKNSMLFMCVHDEGKLELVKRAEIAVTNSYEFIAMLESNIRELENVVDNDFYTYILNEVWEWCTYIRKVAIN